MNNGVKVGDLELIISGKLCRTIHVKEEWDTDVREPQAVIDELKSRRVRADIFSFKQRLPHTKPVFNYRMELDNVAAIPISTYEFWWTKQANQEVRNKVRKSGQKGVIVRVVEFTDDLVRRIKQIYDETSVRRGKKFVDYRISFDDARAGLATFSDRADFLGAFFGDELIGFLKLSYTQEYARTMGILSKIAHRDKAPINALMAKAVEICADKKIPYFVYDKFVYTFKGSDSLTHFKRDIGFQKYDLPKYYVPLSLKGKLLLALNLHKGLKGIVPRSAINLILDLRKRLYSKRYGRKTKVAGS
jgi:hypothetical protein